MCRAPTAAEGAEVDLRSLDPWSCPALRVLLRDCTQSERTPLPWARAVSKIHREHYLPIILIIFGLRVTYFKAPG